MSAGSRQNFPTLTQRWRGGVRIIDGLVAERLESLEAVGGGGGGSEFGLELDDWMMLNQSMTIDGSMIVGG